MTASLRWFIGGVGRTVRHAGRTAAARAPWRGLATSPLHRDIDCARYDFGLVRAHMGWDKGERTYWRLSSELIYQYHKLEKGLALPLASRRAFGLDPLRETLRLLGEWRESGLPRTAKVYRAAIGVLESYRIRLAEDGPQGDLAEAATKLDNILAAEVSDAAMATPIPAARGGCDFEDFFALCRNRRSTRDFDGEPVDFALVERAVAAAQLSPSACNRQPWHLHFYDRREDIDALLALQNGNAGFGHAVPLLAILTSDLSGFFDATERHEPALDGGLFLMSLILALQAQGLTTCCLNWCVTPALDRRCHELAGIDANERILTYLAIGHAAPGASVARSARRPLGDVIRHHRGAVTT